MVYDSARQRLVIFGGGDEGYDNDTWIFTIANATWSKLTTAGPPPPARRLHGAVYDPSGDRMVIFGGWADSLLSDAWQLSFAGTPTWSQISPTGSPGGRADFGCVYDAANDRLVMFGGFDGVSAPCGRTSDTWALSLGATPEWTELAPSGTPPSPRMGVSTGYDAGAQAMYVFGGADTTYSNELWKLSLGSAPAWSRVTTSGDSPSPRIQQAGGFDPVSHRFVVFGGYDDSFVYADLWSIDPGAGSPAWQNVTPDPTIRARWGAGGVVSPVGDFYVEGGFNASGRLEADTWRIHVATPTAWQPIGDLYPYRLQEAMVLDAARHRFIAFGGTDGSYRNDTYVHPLDTGRGWQLLATSGGPPPARRLHTGIYDPDGDRLIVFGGYNGTLLSDLWQLTLSGTPTWSPLAADGVPPSPRGGHLAAYDPVGKRMIISCGYDGVTPPAYRTGTTYALSLTGTPTWSALPDGPPRSSASAVYDAARQSMIVFGGTDPDFLGDTWQLSLGDTPAWSPIAASGPPAREEQSAVYDAHRDRMVIFGGYDTPTPYSHNFDDLWSLDLSATPAWDSLEATGTAPSARWGMKALYDAELDGMWLYGGWDYTYSQQLFFLQWSDPVAPAPIAITSAAAQSDRASLVWELPARAHTTATIQRSTDGTSWRTIGDLIAGATTVPFSDRSVAPGTSYAWRAQVRCGGILMSSSPTWLTIPASSGNPPPAIAFGLRSAGAAARGRLAVVCALPQQSPARVELLDIAGRVRDSRDWSALDAGEHRVELGQDLEPGMFFVRLRAANRAATLKSIVLR